MDHAEHVTFRRGTGIAGQARVRRFASRLAREVAGGRAFAALITSDEELRQLNRDFRGKDAATDVLSFPAGSGKFLGDIAISAARAREQADNFSHSPEDEICVLMLHGVLHLIGMDHESDEGEMRRAEMEWREQLGLPQGLIERAAR